MTQPKSSNNGAMAALIAAFLGWLFDGFEMGLFPLIGKPALQDLLPQASAIVQTQWFTVIIAVFLVGAATGGVLFGSWGSCCFQRASEALRAELRRSSGSSS